MRMLRDNVYYLFYKYPSIYIGKIKNKREQMKCQMACKPGSVVGVTDG